MISSKDESQACAQCLGSRPEVEIQTSCEKKFLKTQSFSFSESYRRRIEGLTGSRRICVNKGMPFEAQKDKVVLGAILGDL